MIITYFTYKNDKRQAGRIVSNNDTYCDVQVSIVRQTTGQCEFDVLAATTFHQNRKREHKVAYDPHNNCNCQTRNTPMSNKIYIFSILVIKAS